MKSTMIRRLRNSAIKLTKELMSHCDPASTVPQSQTISTFENLIDRLRSLQMILTDADALIALARASRVGFVHGDAKQRAGVHWDLKNRILPPLRTVLIGVGALLRRPPRRLVKRADPGEK